MNNFKNSIIAVLSAIILFQSILLVYFMRRESARPKIQRSAAQRTAVTKKEAEVKPVVPVPAPVPVAVKKPELPVPPAVVLGRIALVLDDWGYNLRNRDFITDNDFRITLAVLPFRTFSADVARLAHENHKEIIIHMPMEPHHMESYGLEENTLLTTMSRRTITKSIEAAVRSVPHARGMSNHMGSKGTEDARLMKIVLADLKNRDMVFLDSLVTPRSIVKKVAASIGVPVAERDVFIDNESDPASIRAQILKLAEKARQSGVAVGIGHDRKNTIAVLKEVIPELRAKGYKFVHLSQVLSD